MKRQDIARLRYLIRHNSINSIDAMEYYKFKCIARIRQLYIERVS